MPLKTTRYDTADYLDGPGAVAAYIDAVFEEGDPTLLAHALTVVARGCDLQLSVSRRDGMDARIKSGHDDNLKG
jgi:DNA-binding phage protein